MAVPSLAKLAIGMLIRYRHCITDVGHLDLVSLRAVLSHCNNDELAQIEDGTRTGTGRDLSWYTWDLWFRQYELKFGVSVAAKAQLKPLPGKPPPEYTSPCNAAGPPTADWRGMLERDLAAEKARAASASNRLRAHYAEANRDKATRSAEVCIIKPPPKRRRTSSNAPSSASAPSAHVDKAKLKFLQDIGMKRPKPSTQVHPAAAASTQKTVGARAASGPVKVTRTVVVHKAPGAQAVGSRPVSGLFSAAAGPPERSRPGVGGGGRGGGVGSPAPSRPGQARSGMGGGGAAPSPGVAREHTSGTPSRPGGVASIAAGLGRRDMDSGGSRPGNALNAGKGTLANSSKADAMREPRRGP